MLSLKVTEQRLRTPVKDTAKGILTQDRGTKAPSNSKILGYYELHLNTGNYTHILVATCFRQNDSVLTSVNTHSLLNTFQVLVFMNENGMNMGEKGESAPL